MSASGRRVGGWTTLVRRSPALVLVALVRAYQLLLSPMLGPTCRFYPSCSAYAVQALRDHGAARGAWLTARRLGRCHPWNPGGVDHVPPRRDATTQNQAPRPGEHPDSTPASPATAA